MDTSGAPPQPPPPAAGGGPDSSAADAATGSSERRPPSPDDLFYCYTCEQEIEDVAADFTCPLCRGGFIESIPGRRPTQFLRANAPPDVNEPDGDGQQEMANYANFLTQLMQQAANAGGQHRQEDGPPASGERRPTARPAGGQGAGAADRTAGGQAGANDAGGGDDPMQQLIGQFFQQLMGNLTGEGGQIHIRIGGGDPNAAGGATFQFSAGPEGGAPLHGQMGDYAWGPGGLDAIVTQLLNQFEGAAPQMSEAEIGEVPSVHVDQAVLDRNSQCTTCFDDFKLGESVRQLPCRHIFHNDCIVPWMQRNNTCPICRTTIPAGGSNADGAGGQHEQQRAATSSADASSSGGRPPADSSGGGGGRTAMDEIDELD